MRSIRNIIGVLFLGLCFACLPYSVAHADNGVWIVDNQNGTVTVTYDNSSNKKIAVTVKKDGSSIQYNYFLTESSINAEIPLTVGNGTYKISVLKNIADSRYSPLSSEEVSLSLSDSKSAYLTSNEMISWNTTNNAIKKANALTKKYKSQTSKIKTIYKYIVTKFHYDYDKYSKNSSGNLAYYTPNIEETYATKKGICYDIAALTASMMRSVGIETKMLTGYPASQYYNGAQYHAWNKVYSKKYKKWLIIDATCDMCLYEQGVKYNKLIMKKKASQYSNVKYTW